ncbi:hypothetical protein [Mycobacterium shigaense]|uniref:hypothetical protein n=1 Tax=Mycobacterium shigaense TaxID=722731 RepID=UPI002AE0339E|nr:hypothetical protein [Mycobacterium shigaense]MEA1124899.1 hypothetical protein [Mycobacterium shigaense]
MTHQPPPAAGFAVPARKRPTADIVATVLLFVGQLVASALAFLLALTRSSTLMLPICSDNCDTAEVGHFVHDTWTGALILVSGMGVALLVAACGTLVSGLRGTLMWKWPAIGLVLVVVCSGIAMALWIDATSGTG